MDHKRGCRPAVPVHLTVVAGHKAARGRGTSAVVDRMQLGRELDQLKRQKHIFGLLLLKNDGP